MGQKIKKIFAKNVENFFIIKKVKKIFIMKKVKIIIIIIII